MAIYKLDPATGIETVSGAISRHRAGDKRRYRDIFKEVYAQLKANIASASSKGQVRGK